MVSQASWYLRLANFGFSSDTYHSLEQGIPGMNTAEQIMTGHFVSVPPESTVGRAIEQMLDESACLISIVAGIDALRSFNASLTIIWT